MTSKNKNRQFKNKFSFIYELIKHSKLKIILFASLTFIAFLTGIIVACKIGRGYDGLDRFDLFDFGFGFWGRLFSMLFVASICFGCSFIKFLFPLAMTFLAYRGYLLGLDLALIVICNNFSGIVVSLLIILPCQLAALSVLILMYILLCKLQKEAGCCGKGKNLGEKFKIFIFALIILLVICALESILFVVMSPNVILIV